MKAMKNNEIKKGKENKFLKKMRRKGLIDPWIIPIKPNKQLEEATNN